jgi:DNA-binding beta-propeller fold protein YncE
MKASLLPSVLFLLCLSFALGSAAQTAPEGAPANQTREPAKSLPSVDSNIEVENWVKPEPGWLYVLDPKPDAGGSAGRIWLIDPETGKVMGSIRTGQNADFALSPDGSRLYVASITEGDSSELAAIDTTQGMVLQRGMIEDREVGNVLPAFSTMAVSGDGLALRILLDTPKSADADSFLLATFDTRTGGFLRRSVHLGNCGPGRFISYPTASQFDLLCPRTNRVRLIRVDDDSRELENSDVGLPWERRVGAAEAIEAPGGQEIAIVRGDGAVFTMNVATHEFAETSARPVLPNRVFPSAWPSSPDGSRVYLGYNRDYDRHYDNRFYLDYGRPPNLRPNDATASEFRVLDTRTWRNVGTIKTKTPFWSAVIGNDGKVLYAMVPQKHSILLIDTVKMRQIGVLKVSGMPTLALVAP